MSSRFWFVPAAVALVVLAGALSTPRTPVVAPVVAAPQNGTSTIDDQTDLALTVYNSNLALVRDVRVIPISRGTSDLHFMDIAATVNPATVHFRSLTDPARLRVLEQNYEYDLLEPEKLLRKYVGRDVTVVRMRQDGGVTREEEVKARLLSYNNGPVWRINGEIVTGLRADAFRFPSLPDNLYSRPTLIWTIDNNGGPSQRVEASYLATQLSWNADYVLTVTRDDNAGDLDGWVTLTNGSGTPFRNASLQLVAGDLNLVRQQFMADMAKSRLEAATPVAAPMSQESFSEYHLYTLGRKTSINNSETKQLSMLEATGFPVQKRYVVEGQAYYYRNRQHPGSPIKDLVQVYYQLKNEAKSGLGMPMPAGTVRVYQADSKDGLHFVGEDHISHTPKDETISVKIGNAFDVICERQQTDFEKISDSVYDLEYAVTLRNHKTTPITVEVNEPLGGTWRMLSSSHPWTKGDAWSAKFTVPVASDGTAVLKYRVRITY